MTYTTAPTCADIDALARAACADLPPELARFVDGVVISVEEFPDEEVEREMELESPFDLLGLYQGVALTEKSVHQVVEQPDMIFLYRRPLLDYWCESGEDLTHLIRHVIIHEIGHHFGFSDDDMERIENSD
ncbi:metallopeptidase family protein [Novispirillum sp. DQ9]|uniref:metallopeptidase family protein n=1 Tax=Novispirillum sp. DQ9 TaxID=3398612 RepID=UPI003C7DAA79